MIMKFFLFEYYLGAGIDLTNSMHLWPNWIRQNYHQCVKMTHWVTLLNILSLSGISMGKQALCRSLLESASPSSLQHWIPVSSSPRTVGVCVMSWSTNWPHCISINVYFSLSLRWLVLKELLIRARSFDSTGVIILPKTTNVSIHNTRSGLELKTMDSLVLVRYWSCRNFPWRRQPRGTRGLHTVFVLWRQ